MISIKQDRNLLIKPITKKVKLSVVQKQRLIIDRHNGYKIRELCNKYGVCSKTVHNIINKFNESLVDNSLDGEL